MTHISCEKLYKKAWTIATAEAYDLMSILTTIEQHISKRHSSYRVDSCVHPVITSRAGCLPLNRFQVFSQIVDLVGCQSQLELDVIVADHVWQRGKTAIVIETACCMCP